VARGFKSGGFNLTSTERGRGYAPEWAWSYEGGFKTVVGGGRARFNATAFQVSYSDLQVSAGIRPGVIDISNAAEATIRGLEIEAASRLSDRLQAGGHVAWLDAAYDRYIATGADGVTQDVRGHRLNNAPAWSGRTWLDFTTGLGSEKALWVRGDVTWQTTVFYTPFNDQVQRQRPYGLLTLGADFGPRDRRWTAGVYGRNLTNEDYITGTFGTPAPAIGGRPGEPRELGVRFTVRR
jgi:iron complex outermembrane receptor protein